MRNYSYLYLNETAPLNLERKFRADQNSKLTRKIMNRELFSKTLKLVAVGTTVAVSFYGTQVLAAPYTLNNGTGDGTLRVGVDGFGSFGSSVGSNATNAFYDPIGSQGPTNTSFESGLAIGFGGQRTFLTSGDIGGSGSLTNPTVTGTSTLGQSSFSFNGLGFNLTQALSSIFTEGSQTGSLLTQTYSITNTTSSDLNFDLVRYLDGDLQFDGSITDGGGRIDPIGGGTEILFETDSATGTADLSTFVGITGQGGTIPTSNRYEINGYSGLRSKIISGTSLNNTIAGDGADPDQFIDAGNGYDVTLALRNVFLLAPGETTSYTTQTAFGAGEPGQTVPGSSQDFPILPDVLEPGTFTFEEVPSGNWFDPPLAEGFNYTMTGNSLFTEVGLPVGIDADNLYNILVGNTSLGQFAGGDTINFANLFGSNVSQFSITGINPAVDAANPNAFPTFLSFDTPTASFTMSAITGDVPPQGVPEPTSTLGLLTFGLLGANSVWKRRQQQKA